MGKIWVRCVSVCMWIGLCSAPSAFAEFSDGFLSLPAVQQQKILDTISANGVASQYLPLQNSAWPEAVHYFIIHASPTESAAVFHDYARQVDFLSGMQQSTVRARAPGVDEVDYVMTVGVSFFHSVEEYTARNAVEMQPGAVSARYRITSQMIVSSQHLQSAEGAVVFEPLSSDLEGGTTLCTYHSKIVPIIPWAIPASWTVEPSKKFTLHAALRMARRVHELKQQNPALLMDEIVALTEIFRSTDWNEIQWEPSKFLGSFL